MQMRWLFEPTIRACALWAAAILALHALVLTLFGQPLICACGYVKAWEGVVLSAGNSQHLSDWYTFSHVIHGFIFYWVLWLLFPRMPLVWRFLLALGVEVGWEILENTPQVIAHYREQALAQGYTGDSIINSLMDSLAMILGFVLSRRLPVWTIVALAIGMELFVLYMIRDNLALNVLNLIHQFDFVSTWQAAAPPR